tara:strand:- start:57 stop:806 length:750 start_codon:yes stop_codon:yes gene_type:complete
MKNKKLKTLLIFLFFSVPLLFLIKISFWWSNYTDTSQINLKFSRTEIIDIENYKVLINEILNNNKENYNLTQITNVLEEHPYVKAARVSRHYPNQIKIEIIERVPITMVNKDPIVLLDEQGYVLPDFYNLKSYDLPIMSNFNTDSGLYPPGEMVLSVKAKECILLLANIQNQYNELYNNLSELKITSSNEINLILADQPTNIFLGNENINIRINILKEFEKQLKPAKISDFTYLDLRFKNQVIGKRRHL